MGCFPCFDSKEEEKLNNPAAEIDDRKQGQPTVSNNISRLPSGQFLIAFAYQCLLFSNLNVLLLDLIWVFFFLI